MLVIWCLNGEVCVSLRFTMLRGVKGAGYHMSVEGTEAKRLPQTIGSNLTSLVTVYRYISSITLGSHSFSPLAKSLIDHKRLSPESHNGQIAACTRPRHLDLHTLFKRAAALPFEVF